MPDVPDLHQVGCAARQDENAEHPEDAIEGETASLANEIDENDRNAVIRQGDEGVGNDVQPHHARIPQVAEAVRHEIRRKELLKQSHGSGSHWNYRQGNYAPVRRRIT
jgi:hypothetical protein